MASSDNRIDTLEKAVNSELLVKNDNIETIDIIPVIKGGDDFMSIFIIVVGVILIATGIGAALSPAFAAALGGISGTTAFAIGMVGVGLVFAGISNLLAEPPKFDDFKDPGQKKLLVNLTCSTVPKAPRARRPGSFWLRKTYSRGRGYNCHLRNGLQRRQN